MNSFKFQYTTFSLDSSSIELIEKILSENNESYDQGTTGFLNQESDIRQSKIRFIKNSELFQLVGNYIQFANSDCYWNLDVDFIEPLQDTLYEVGDFYDWHIDESDWVPNKRPGNRIRKISFIILLNDDFECGELEFQFDEKRLIDFKKGDIIVFQSDIPHRVRPVTSGKRRSLVGWVQGPAYK
jgi:PKHD-type hydroxylase